MKSKKPRVLTRKTTQEIEILRAKAKLIEEADAKRKEFNNAKASLIQEATDQFIKRRDESQERCNHRKGGRGIEGIINGQGTDANYAVIKHTLPNGGVMVLCQRCGKEWHPADPFTKTPATPGWNVAVNFITDNIPSGGATFFDTNDPKAVAKRRDSLIRELQEEILEHRTTVARLETEVRRLSNIVSNYRPNSFFNRLKIAFQILRGN